MRPGAWNWKKWKAEAGEEQMTLKTRTLGKSGICVTEIGFGLWAAGGGDWGASNADADAEILSAIDTALDSGVTFFDTADVYGGGHSETLLGQSMAGRRDRFVVATKIGWQNFDDDNQISAYRTTDQLITGVETNLRRLQTDYVDVIQSHIDFREPTMEIFLEAFQKLQSAGKVRAFGLSTSDFEYLKAFNQDMTCATLQIDYSMLNRTPEQEILQYCQNQDIGVIVRGALAMGLLTGKFSETTEFASGDFRNNWLTDQEQNQVFREDLHKVDQLRTLSVPGRTLAQAALNFVLQHDAVTTVIPGARNPKQVLENMLAAQAPEFSPEELQLIDHVTPPGGGRKIWPA